MARKQLSDLDFNSQSRIRNLLAPSNPDEPARKADLDAAIEGLKSKENVFVCAQGNVNLASPGATIDGQTPTSGSRSLGSVLLRTQTNNTENGIYIWNGAASAMTRVTDANSPAELNNALVAVNFGTDAGKTFRQTSVITTIGVDAILWSVFGSGSTAATETQAGIAELATQAETDAGTDDARIVTPLKLNTWSGKTKRGQLTFGDGSATQFDFTHNLNTRDITASVWQASGSYERVECDMSMPNVNTLRLNFSAAPALNSLRVVVVG